MTQPTTQQAEQFLQWIRRHQRPIVVTHVNPDGDAAGSLLALGALIRALGGEPELVCHHPLPENLLFLPGADQISLTAARQNYELAVIADLNSPSRLGSFDEVVLSAKHRILIDHHEKGSIEADTSIVDVAASATALLTYRLYRALDIEISPEIAVCLLTGILTDTGSFRYPNTTGESLHAAAHLVEIGAPISKISEYIYGTQPLESKLVQMRVLENMQFVAGGNGVWSILRPEDFQKIGANDTHAEGAASELLSIRGVKIAAMLRQEPGKKIRVSFRSREPFDVSELAGQFGGGGHRLAAGCTFENDLEEAAQNVANAIKQCLES